MAVLLGRSRAAWGDSAEPEALIRQGLTLRQQGRDEAALPYFQKAYEIARTPRSIGQLGFAEMAVGYWLEAEAHIAEALAFPDHPWVAKNRATLTSALVTVRTKIGEVDIVGSPRGATVIANGRTVGALPLASSLRLAQGSLDVEVRSVGYITTTRSVRVEGGDHQRLVIDLEMIPVFTRQDQLPVATAQSSPAVQPGGSVLSRRSIGWVSGGVAVAALGTAIAFQVAALARSSDFNRGCGIDPSGRPVSDPTSQAGLSDQQCANLRDSWQSDRVWAATGFTLAGALVVTSAVLFATSGPQRRLSAIATRSECWSMPGGVMCGAVF
jgi:hypothetical protein